MGCSNFLDMMGRGPLMAPQLSLMDTMCDLGVICVSPCTFEQLIVFSRLYSRSASVTMCRAPWVLSAGHEPSSLIEIETISFLFMFDRRCFLVRRTVLPGLIFWALVNILIYCLCFLATFYEVSKHASESRPIGARAASDLSERLHWCGDEVVALAVAANS